MKTLAALIIASIMVPGTTYRVPRAEHRVPPRTSHRAHLDTGHRTPDTASVSLSQMIGQMIMVGFRGKSVSEDSSIYADIVDRHIGGVVLFDYDVPNRKADRNIESPEQVAALTATLQRWADTSLLIAIDQEGGRVNRLKQEYGFPKSVSARYLGSIDNVDSTRFYAERTAEVLSELGLNVNFSPVVDLNLNPDNPIIGGIERSFSADPEEVVQHAAIVVRSHRRHGVLTALKHFPGHGSSKDDTHLGLVDVTETWEESELYPYRRLVEMGLVDAVMTAHVVNRALDTTGTSSTLSRPVIEGILRSVIGFDGVVFSDDLQMGAIRDHYELESVVYMAIEAGVDIMTFANNSVYDPEIAARVTTAVERLVSEGKVTKSRIRESYERIMSLKARISGS